MKQKNTNTPQPTKHNLKLTWWHLIATWFGCGLSPSVSGTVGSLGALPFAYFIQYYTGSAGLCAAAVFIFIVGCKASNLYLLHTGRDDDPSEIVVDEVAGQWLLLSFLPFTWHAYLAGFILFRAFDIVKPWPICVADRKIKGGFGVMFDDILAALYPVAVYFLALAGAACIGREKLVYEWLSFLT